MTRMTNGSKFSRFVILAAMGFATAAAVHAIEVPPDPLPFPFPDRAHLGQRWDYLGEAACAVGDIDGDGCDDYAIGSPITGEYPDNGVLRIHSGRTGVILREHFAPYLGSTLAAAGDVDGDGFGDYMAQARVGPRVFIYSGATGQTIHALEDAEWTTNFGAALDGLGDVNDDGYGDFVISAPNNHVAPHGRIIVFSGIDASVLYEREGVAAPDSDGFGYCVSAIGDLDGDACSDFIVGAATHERGRAIIYSGRTGDVIWQKDGHEGFARYGYAVAGVGDVNGDSVPDFAVGAKLLTWDQVNEEWVPQRGTTYVHSGADFSILHKVTGESDGDMCGSLIAPAGDFNGDGHADILIAAPGNEEAGPGAGKMYVISGSSGAALLTVTGGRPRQVNDWFPTRIKQPGDFNGDGLSDLIVPFYMWDGTSGAAFIYDGGQFTNGGGTLNVAGWRVRSGEHLRGGSSHLNSSDGREMKIASQAGSARGKVVLNVSLKGPSGGGSGRLDFLVELRLPSGAGRAKLFAKDLISGRWKRVAMMPVSDSPTILQASHLPAERYASSSGRVRLRVRCFESDSSGSDFRTFFERVVGGVR